MCVSVFYTIVNGTVLWNLTIPAFALSFMSLKWSCPVSRCYLASFMYTQHLSLWCSRDEQPGPLLSLWWKLCCNGDPCAFSEGTLGPDEGPDDKIPESVSCTLGIPWQPWQCVCYQLMRNTNMPTSSPVLDILQLFLHFSMNCFTFVLFATWWI